MSRAAVLRPFSYLRLVKSGIITRIKGNRLATGCIRGMMLGSLLLWGGFCAAQGRLRLSSTPVLGFSKTMSDCGSADLRLHLPGPSSLAHSPFSLHVFTGSLELPERPAPDRLSPDAYYNACYGFFCKMEWWTQSQWHLPLAFRLGSYQEERKMEGEE